MTEELTREEWELIQAIRNYRKAYPNGKRMLEAEINEILDELMDIQYEEKKED